MNIKINQKNQKIISKNIKKYEANTQKCDNDILDKEIDENINIKENNNDDILFEEVDEMEKGK